MKWNDVVLIILFIVAVVMVFWYLFGNSPTIEQTLLILILTFLYSLHGEVKALSYLPAEVSAIKERLSTVEQSFASITAKRTRG